MKKLFGLASLLLIFLTSCSFGEDTPEFGGEEATIHFILDGINNPEHTPLDVEYEDYRVAIIDASGLAIFYYEVDLREPIEGAKISDKHTIVVYHPEVTYIDNWYKIVPKEDKLFTDKYFVLTKMTNVGNPSNGQIDIKLQSNATALFMENSASGGIVEGTITIEKNLYPTASKEITVQNWTYMNYDILNAKIDAVFNGAPLDQVVTDFSEEKGFKAEGNVNETGVQLEYFK
ncbi:hypothetical protein [Aureibacter tunicatorum]|uniref:Lipoprotein n=1 Tax=Aureibacter tunicatorum TaxID=866807 RepID=A0AAE3XJC1_9BACT|nr:hypothetical protein [Aureibacter tunicatorum]MDR6237932.1 hypothetical protein [Aureibacter tunicatorum]BDD02965.1 hypothetical protein AUTU_04480 [Aureibacter tunicatorum]